MRPLCAYTSLLGAAVAVLAVGHEAHASAEARALAHRFRPYLKFSVDGEEERFRPCSWQWLLARSDLDIGTTPVPCRIVGRTVATPDTLARNPREVLHWADIREWGDNYAENACVLLDPEHYRGQPWAEVEERGAGLYAHVTPLDARLINIEYWLLFAYNRATIAPGLNSHQGDIVGVQLVYDRGTDRIIRAGFSAHGEVLQIFDLTRSLPSRRARLEGKDRRGRRVVEPALRYEVLPHGFHHSDTKSRGAFFTTFRSSAPLVYFVQDEVTKRYEHLAVFFEWGAHEPWPNPTGRFTGAPKHRGDGVSFLPNRVHLLGPADEPFELYGGQIGKAAGLRRHEMWLLGTGEIRVGAADRPPYDLLPPLAWPPRAPEHAGCRWLEPTSEEKPPRSCPRDTFVTALACDGRYCDNVAIQCCPIDGLERRGASRRTEFFSEENPRGQSCPPGQLVTGLRCRGRYCDDIALTCSGTTKSTHFGCRWTLPFSEEGRAQRECTDRRLVTGARCTGRYCDQLSLRCCTAR